MVQLGPISQDSQREKNKNDATMTELLLDNVHPFHWFAVVWTPKLALSEWAHLTRQMVQERAHVYSMYSTVQFCTVCTISYPEYSEHSEYPEYYEHPEYSQCPE